MTSELNRGRMFTRLPGEAVSYRASSFSSAEDRWGYQQGHVFPGQEQSGRRPLLRLWLKEKAEEMRN